MDEGSGSASQSSPATLSTSCSHARPEHTETSSSRGLCSLLVSWLGEDISAARENFTGGTAELLQSRFIFSLAFTGACGAQSSLQPVLTPSSPPLHNYNNNSVARPGSKPDVQLGADPRCQH